MPFVRSKGSFLARLKPFFSQISQKHFCLYFLFISFIYGDWRVLVFLSCAFTPPPFYLMVSPLFFLTPRARDVCMYVCLHLFAARALAAFSLFLLIKLLLRVKKTN